MKFNALPTITVRALQEGGRDANGMKPETQISSGAGNPCRHCLRNIPQGHEMLVLAHRPFETLQPYAETGPIFLCADKCDRGSSNDIPDILTTSPDYLLKGYDSDARIIYGTGAIVARANLREYARNLLDRGDIAWVDVRSARNNCYQLRITRD